LLREVRHSSSSVSSSNPEDAPFESMITRFVSERPELATRMWMCETLSTDPFAHSVQ
jgi:hypothetical protein